ncbi:MAG: RNA 2'-phosphotransferase, partial [Actinomycetia bacterium]|nr:RNA 2'-phosphotransferase [Actinomycetes bacterium]
MDEKATVRISRFLSMVLRHRPETVGITLDEGGWVDVDVLIAACAAAGRRFSRADLDHVVATNNKRRFAYSADGRRIRASQGHSVEVDLGLTAATPPDVLYHGTASTTVAAILREGLRPMSRQDVHLSADRETAVRVGARHGRPVVLE